MKIKEHIKEHKRDYTIAITSAGITYLIMRGRHAVLQSGADGLAKVTVRPFSLFSNRMSTIVNVVEREGRGHPGYLIMCRETQEHFKTQGLAANAARTSASVMSRHIRGDIPDIGGLHYERIPG